MFHYYKRLVESNNCNIIDVRVSIRKKKEEEFLIPRSHTGRTRIGDNVNSRSC